MTSNIESIATSTTGEVDRRRTECEERKTAVERLLSQLGPCDLQVLSAVAQRVEDRSLAVEVRFVDDDPHRAYLDICMHQINRRYGHELGGPSMVCKPVFASRYAVFRVSGIPYSLLGEAVCDLTSMLDEPHATRRVESLLREIHKKVPAPTRRRGKPRATRALIDELWPLIVELMAPIRGMTLTPAVSEPYVPTHGEHAGTGWCIAANDGVMRHTAWGETVTAAEDLFLGNLRRYPETAAGLLRAYADKQRAQARDLEIHLLHKLAPLIEATSAR